MSNVIVSEKDRLDYDYTKHILTVNGIGLLAFLLASAFSLTLYEKLITISPNATGIKADWCMLGYGSVIVIPLLIIIIWIAICKIIRHFYLKKRKHLEQNERLDQMIAERQKKQD